MNKRFSNLVRRRWLLGILLTLAIAWLVLAAQPIQTTANSRVSPTERGNALPPFIGLENYDIRTDESVLAKSDVDSYRRRFAVSGEEKSRMNVAMQDAESHLADRVPGLKIEWNELWRAPEVVGATTVGVPLTGPSSGPHEKIVRDFVSDQHALYGLTRQQAAELKRISDYTNPARNISWVELRQEIHGIPVFQAELRAAMSPRGELSRTVSNLVPGLDYENLSTKPRLSAANAVVAGAASIGVVVDRGKLHSLVSEQRHAVFTSSNLSDQTRVELLYFPIEHGVAVLSWSMVLWQPESSYYVIVDTETGRLLFRKCITFHQSQSATYSVYDNDSPAPLSPTTALPGSPVVVPGISRTSITVISESPSADNLGWIPDGANTTTGNNVDAGIDVEPPIGIDPNGRPVGNPFRVFDFTYNPPPIGNDPPSGANYRFGSVTNLFFWANRLHDRLYEAGFTEGARNFQNNNFGRGGLEQDPLVIQAHRSTLSASVSAPPDGMSPILITGASASADIGLDQEVILHEATHAVSSRLHGNGTGLGSLQAGGMGEGWSDFYTRALLSSADESLEGNFALAAYSTTYVFNLPTDSYYYGLRRFPYAIKSSRGANGLPHNPLTFADIDPTQINADDGAYPRSPLIGNTATEVHNSGEIWCLALLEVRARLIRRLGFVEGNRRALQLVTDGMKLDPLNPRFLQSRDAILAADLIGFNGADLADIWRGFAARGLGIGATSIGTSVSESFLFPVRHRFDFDGDWKSDFAVFRPSDGQWYVLNSSNNTSRVQAWGLGSDVLTPGDYDGDSKGDFAVFRPSSGTWYVLQSSNNTFRGQVFGAPGDVTVPGDYDGDNRDDFAVFRGGAWLILQSSTNSIRSEQWGLGTDRPVIGDFDGDMRTDLAVFRPSDGTWYIQKSSTNTYSSEPFGLNGDLPVPGDYDGDGRDDFAVFRSGTWYIKQSVDNAFRSHAWGLSTDRPVPGDYDGDGITDVAVFRPAAGTWFVLQSTNGALSARQWGQAGDSAIPSAYVP